MQSQVQWIVGLALGCIPKELGLQHQLVDVNFVEISE